MKPQISVGLVGAGSMGGALLRGWIESDLIDVKRSAVFDPSMTSELRALCKTAGIPVNPKPDECECHVVLVAVKPQIAGEVLPAFSHLANKAIVVSVMAGKSVAAISHALGGAKKIARAMPNLPSSIGKGAGGLYANEAVDPKGRATVETLMAATGRYFWVDTEEAIDFVTAVSGSGPAYYFLLTEALGEAGKALGLPDELAQQLAKQTAIGAGALMEKGPRDPSELREAVTSPGGTTAAALDVFDGDKKPLRELVSMAVEAAAKRARELTA